MKSIIVSYYSLFSQLDIHVDHWRWLVKVRQLMSKAVLKNTLIALFGLKVDTVPSMETATTF